MPRIVWTFIVGNLAIMAALGVLAWLDQYDIERHLITLAERMVTQQGIMTFLGATTVQVGAIAFVIAKYLFPHRPHDS